MYVLQKPSYMTEVCEKMRLFYQKEKLFKVVNMFTVPQ